MAQFKFKMSSSHRKISSGPPWYSSYLENHFGHLIYGLIRTYKPQKVVELGTKAGFSAYHIAKALKANKKGVLHCYDLWEKYQYHSVPLSTAKKNLQKFADQISFFQQDASEVHKKYKPGEVDILHVDLSNDGDLLDQIIPHWIDLINQFIIIEGGSKERDQIEWMTKYNKIPINKWLKKLKNKTKVDLFTLDPFPSITLIKKK